MHVITCAGYYNTGSSAVTDLFAEFNNVGSIGKKEIRFLHDPNGIRDLEYNLIENNNRHNTSNAIKNYYEYAKILNGGIIRKGYRRYMGDSFMKYTNEYIDNITELKCDSWWHYDRIRRGALFNFADIVFTDIVFTDIVNWPFIKLKKNYRITLLKLLHEKGYFSAIDKETFYKYTIDYVEKVLQSMNKENKEYFVVDQLLPPSNVSDYMNYIKDVKLIIVDRDPRDVFILQNELALWRIIPCENIDEFCKWYEIIRRKRKTEKYDKDKVFFLKFEDMVYRYDKTVKELIDFVGLRKQDHIIPKSFFNPDISIKGTNLKIKYTKYQTEIKEIEKKLKDYLYDFS